MKYIRRIAFLFIFSLTVPYIIILMFIDAIGKPSRFAENYCENIKDFVGLNKEYNLVIRELKNQLEKEILKIKKSG